MRTYAAFLTVVAAAAAPFRHRGRDKIYWNVEDPDRLYGPLGAEPFEALSVACKRTAARLTRATATEESFEDAGACLDALVARGKLGAAYSKLTSGVRAAASQTSFRRRLQDAPMRPRAGQRGVVRAPPRARARAQGKAIPRISSHGLGAFMTAMNVTLNGFADVIDETQMSLELYFYARELNRADHMLLGLAPPGVGLLPPGEADVFAGRA